uniref:Thioredoxin n=1 Tax=Suberites ficus TaxID=86007 RepID=Q6ZYL0_SUBFI|nr:thioredoxin [Suberites ficus]
MPKFLKNKDEFDTALSDAKAAKKWVVIDFTASWCGPCKMIAPKFEEMEKQFTNVAFYKIDVDDNDEVAEAQGISAMPTFKFFYDGVEEKSKTMKGANEAKLRSTLEEISK